MKTRFKKLLLAPLVWLSACASTHPGNLGALVNGGTDATLVVSGEKQSDASDKNYLFVTFTVENKGDDMARITATDLDFYPEDQAGVSVLVGKDLVDWASALEEQQKVAKNNARIGQLALVLGGALLGVTGSATNNNTLKIIGSTGMLVGAGMSLTDTISSSVKNAKNPKKVPETHIYEPFSVPAGKFLRRWAVIQKPKDKPLKRLLLKLTQPDHSEQVYAIQL